MTQLSKSHPLHQHPASTTRPTYFEQHPTQIQHAPVSLRSDRTSLDGSRNPHTHARAQASFSSTGGSRASILSLTWYQIVRRMKRGLRPRAPLPSGAGGAPTSVLSSTINNTKAQKRYNRFYAGSGLILPPNPSGRSPPAEMRASTDGMISICFIRRGPGIPVHIRDLR